MLTKLFKSLTLVLTTIFIVACSDNKAAMVQIDGKTMGTYYVVKFIEQDDLPNNKAIKAGIDDVLELVNDQMSTYRPDSELSQFNQHRGAEGFAVSDATAKVVTEAIRINAVTEGALDVTVGPLVNLWGFGPEAKPEKVPSTEEIAARRAVTGIEKLHVDGNELHKSIPELYVDLSSIAKGYGVDKVADYLTSLGIDNFLVEIGGELRVKGLNSEGIGWRIAIEKPVEEGRTVQEIVSLGDNSIATSGDYRNYHEFEGVRYSHMIDPQTAKPIDHRLVSVTVIHPSNMTADALSTGLMIVGPEKAQAIADKHGLNVYLIRKTDNGYESYMSEGFKPFVQ
ncbi:FAD:protein FMN transferase [Thaumasiovibrio subtropicus]|uniref:FAD:protein FMN transferase n=1 Tax=Thaumasiovibrio subtropicus TaxID=1891207 RepID=UPI000B35F95E|nr:FAD:protein FMN transferase [Thaumasiovibrio subtropicus]